jgi:Zn-dependent protease with chaperone function
MLFSGLGRVLVTFLVRAALAVLLLLGVFVLAVGMVGGLAFALYQAFEHGYGGFVLGKGLVIVLLLTLALGRAAWAMRRLNNDGPAGLVIAPDDQPALWAEVRAVAYSVGTRVPDEIRLLPVVNAYVWEDSRLLGLISGRRVMALGAPLLMGLSQGQLRAVLAHELGHYAHGHTALAPVVYRGQVALGRIVWSLGDGTWSGRIFAAYARLYLRVARSVTRQQEVEADAWSYRVAGRVASVGVMREVPALNTAWMDFLDDYAFAVRGVRPDSLFEGFGKWLANPERQRALETLRRELPDHEHSPYDSHPTPSQRVEFFESLPEDVIAEKKAPAMALLANGPGLLAALETVMFAETELEARPWPWIAETSGLERARRGAALLKGHSGEPGTGAAGLRLAIQSLGRDHGRSLVRPFMELSVTTPEEVLAAARSLVRASVSGALVAHCGARFCLAWDSSEALVDPDGQRIDVAGAVDAVTDKVSADQLIRALVAEGVPASFTVDGAEADIGAREANLQAVAVCVNWRRLRVLVLADDELIIKRVGLVEGLSAMFRPGATADGYYNAMLHVASIPLERLRADSRAQVFGWEQVGAAVVTGTRLALTLDGKQHRMRLKRHAIAGDLVGSLRLHLGRALAAT